MAGAMWHHALLTLMLDQGSIFELKMLRLIYYEVFGQHRDLYSPSFWLRIYVLVIVVFGGYGT